MIITLSQDLVQKGVLNFFFQWEKSFVTLISLFKCDVSELDYERSTTTIAEGDFLLLHIANLNGALRPFKIIWLRL